VRELAGAPERLTIDLDTTLLTACSDKVGAEPTYRRPHPEARDTCLPRHSSMPQRVGF
jgi:hypothetical protein